MSWNKRYLGLRILSFPLKLVFQVLWNILMGIFQSIHWLRNGSQELLYGKDHGKCLVRLIEQNEKLIESLEKQNSNG